MLRKTSSTSSSHSNSRQRHPAAQQSPLPGGITKIIGRGRARRNNNINGGGGGGASSSLRGTNDEGNYHHHDGGGASPTPHGPSLSSSSGYHHNNFGDAIGMTTTKKILFVALSLFFAAAFLIPKRPEPVVVVPSPVMSSKTTTGASAGGMAANKAVFASDKNELHPPPNEQRQQQPSSDRRRPGILEADKHKSNHQFIPQSIYDPTDNTTILHMVFSTDCRQFQHWQSYLFFYSALRIGQPGYITRIASGCKTDEQRVAEQEWHDTHIRGAMSDRFRLHMTPDFNGYVDKSSGQKKEYFYTNKPNGLRHWLEHGDGMGFVNDDGDGGGGVEGSEEGGKRTTRMKNEDAVVILMDSDMVLMKPLTSTYTMPPRYRERMPSFPTTDVRVKHGQPVAQKYGFGDVWLKFNMTHVTSDPQTPASHVTSDEAWKYYPAGPPYMATLRDMHSIATKWTEFVSTVVSEDGGDMLAEMYAYCIASAHLQLRHVIVPWLMASDVSGDSYSEGWIHLEKDVALMETCDVAATYPVVGTTTAGGSGGAALLPSTKSGGIRVSGRGDPSSSSSKWRKQDMPYLLHYCQGYKVGPGFFTKYRMPYEIFTCRHPLLVVPPSDLGKPSNHYKFKGLTGSDTVEREELKPNVAQRSVFMICGITAAVNEAGEFFKKQHCFEDGMTRWDKTTNLTLMDISF